ncbi:hypothetical protein Agub_g2288, partial [Astrephomene gubernaculifera]
MPCDWACDSCTFVNSGLLPSCELCGALRSGVPQSGPDDPITLSDDDDTGAAALPPPKPVPGATAAGNSKDVVDLANDFDEPQKRNTINTRASRQTARQPVADVTIIDDDEEAPKFNSLIPRPHLGHAAGPNKARRPRSELIPDLGQHPDAAGRRPADETFSLDGCGCTLPLSSLAAQLQPVLTAATASTAATAAAAGPVIKLAAAGQAVGQANGGCGGGDPAVLQQNPTLLDLAAPLACPTSRCRGCLSSRDVRLLLGPYGTRALYGAMCTALRREAKAAKATKREHGGSGAGPSSAAAAAAATQMQIPQGRRNRGGGKRSTAAPTAECSGAAVPQQPAQQPQPHTPLLPLAPSCPACHSRTLATSVLRDLQQAQQQQTSAAASMLQPDQLCAALAARGGLPPPPPPAAAAAAATAAGSKPATRSTRTASLASTATDTAAAAGGAGGGLTSLASRLLDAVGPRCAFVCLSCPESCEEGAVASPGRLQALQAEADLAARVLRLLRRVRAVLLSAQEEEEEEDEEDGDGGDAAAKGAEDKAHGAKDWAAAGWNGRGGRGSRRRRSGGRRGGGGGRYGDGGGRYGDGGKAWAKGVGYGGGQGGHNEAAAAAAAVKAAQERQRQADEEVKSCLSELLVALSAGASSGAGRATGGGGGSCSSSGGALASPPPVLLAALQCGGLPYILRLLLQNESLLDMGQRQGLYNVVLSVVRRIVSNMSLLELLVLPASDPLDTSAPAPSASAAAAGAGAAAAAAGGGGGLAGGGGGGGAGEGSSDPPLGAVFESLGRQCAVFKRAAQDLADGAEEDIAALGLALELG